MPRTLIIGAVLSAIFVLMALVSFVWTPFDHTALDIGNKLKNPTGAHWFGTDHFGRDIFSMIMVGARTSIAVAVVAVGIGILLGVPMGLAAATPRELQKNNILVNAAIPLLPALIALYFAPGFYIEICVAYLFFVGVLIVACKTALLDELITRSNDLIFAFPSLVIAILITAIYGQSAFNAIIAIGIFNTPVFARVARGAAISLWQREFILAARVAGKGPVRISAEHILPNILNLLIVQGTIQFSLGILAEAGLSYVGLGAQPPTPSWGRMLADSQTMISFAPHLAIFPGLAIVLTVLGLNLMGDGLRDFLDPRLRRDVS